MTTTTAFHYRRNPPRRPSSCSGHDPDRLRRRRRQRRRHPCTTNRHDGSPVQQVDPYAVTEIPCVCAPLPPPRWTARSIHTPERSSTAPPPPSHRRRVGVRVVCFRRRAGERGGRRVRFSRRRSAGAPDFSPSRCRPSGGEIDGSESCWHCHCTLPWAIFSFYARKPFDKNYSDVVVCRLTVELCAAVVVVPTVCKTRTYEVFSLYSHCIAFSQGFTIISSCPKFRRLQSPCLYYGYNENKSSIDPRRETRRTT